MPDGSVNIVDAGVAVVLILSALLAFSRGLVKESLAVAGWVGAAFVTLYLYPFAAPYSRKYIPITIAADAATVIAIFVVTLVVISIVSHQISTRVRESAIGPLDRSLGFLFGLARGAVVVIVAYMLLTWLIPPQDHPKLVTDARVTPWVQRGAELMAKLVPETSQAREAVEGALDEAGRLNDQTGGQLERAIKQSIEDTGAKLGYKPNQLNQMDQLIKSNQDE